MMALLCALKTNFGGREVRPSLDRLIDCCCLLLNCRRTPVSRRHLHNQVGDDGSIDMALR